MSEPSPSVPDLESLRLYSAGRISSIELRRRLGGVSYGEVLIGLAQHGLPLPQAAQAGREREIDRARALLFPKRHAAE